ncbi:MAG: MFS transporter [Alphaproteobacteria bacterium]|nr:MFS transporter [Alphaproteobacteria bacterium]
MSSAGAPPLAIVLLAFAAFAAAANMRAVDPLLIAIAAEYGTSVGEASIAATTFLLANGLFVLVHGPLGDRFGKVPVVTAGAIGAALFSGLSALAGSLETLAVARFLTGVTSSAIIPLAIAWVGDRVSYDRRQATLARFLTGQTLGLMAGAALGGAIGDWLGWRAAFWLLAVVYVASALALLLVARAQPALLATGARSEGSMLAQMRRVLARPWARFVIVTVAIEGGLFWGAFTFVGADLHRRFELDRAAVGLAVAAFAAGGFLYVSAAPRLLAWLGERGLCLGGGVLLGVAFAALAIAPGLAVAFAAIVASGVGFYMFHNTLQTHGTQMAPEARGAAMALFALCLFIGQAIGVPLAAPVVDRWGAVPLFAGIAIALPVLAWTFARGLARRTADQASGARQT